MAPQYVADDDHLRGQGKKTTTNPDSLTVTPELSELLQRTSELAAGKPAAAVETQQQQPSSSKGNGDDDDKPNQASSSFVVANCGSKRRRPSSAGAGRSSSSNSRGGSANNSNLRLRRAPSHCPSCSGAPFTDATFLQDYDYDEREERGGGGDDENDKDDNTTAAACRDLAAEARLWVLENGRAASAPLLALLVVAASVTWSLYEYAGSSAAALAGPALYAAKACVATSQACYG